MLSNSANSGPSAGQKLIAATCLQMALSDEPWQDFGFSKRPKHGALFQRFRSPWKRELETKLLQEMLAMFTAAYVVAGKLSPDSLNLVIAMYVERPDVVRALGYTSQDDAIIRLVRTITRYKRLPAPDWADEIARKIDPASVPDKAIAALLWIGCVRFAQNVGGMILVLRRDNNSSGETV